jgi:hypothetical protein
MNTDPADPTTPAPGRPWAAGIGLLLLGLAVSAFANQLALRGGAGPALAALGTMGYLAGVLVSGSGIHRILWYGPARRSRAVRFLLTAVVTVPAFVGTAILLSVLMSVFQRRFMP